MFCQIFLATFYVFKREHYTSNQSKNSTLQSADHVQVIAMATNDIKYLLSPKIDHLGSRNEVRLFHLVIHHCHLIGFSICYSPPYRDGVIAFTFCSKLGSISGKACP